MKHYLIKLIIFLFLGSIAMAQDPSFVVNGECTFAQITFRAYDSIWADSSIDARAWDLDADGSFDDGITESVFYAYSTAGTYTVGLIVDPNGYPADTFYKDIVIYNSPTIDFQVTDNCQFSEINYLATATVSGTNINNYGWDFFNDGGIDQYGQNVTFVPGEAVTSYVSKLIVETDQGCKDSLTKSIIVYKTPVPDFSFNMLCQDSITSFTDASTISEGAISTYIWDFGDGTKDASLGDITHTYSAAGTYSVWLKVISDENCSDSIQDSLTILPNPTVSITAPDTTVVDGESVNITVSGSASTYTWSTGDVSTSLTITEEGIYSVVGVDVNGCGGMDEISIKGISDEVRLESIIVTPNGDGINDGLRIENIELYSACSVEVYNRWNKLIFSYDQYTNSDEEVSEFNNLSAGTYFYVVKCDDKEQKVGTINVLK